MPGARHPLVESRGGREYAEYTTLFPPWGEHGTVDVAIVALPAVSQARTALGNPRVW